jgi:hypothetical protein
MLRNNPCYSRSAGTIDNEIYIRDYSKSVLCYKCVEACGVDAQTPCYCSGESRLLRAYCYGV